MLLNTNGAIRRLETAFSFNQERKTAVRKELGVSTT